MRTLNYLLKNGTMTTNYAEAVAEGYVKTVLIDEAPKPKTEADIAQAKLRWQKIREKKRA